MFKSILQKMNIDEGTDAQAAGEKPASDATPAEAPGEGAPAVNIAEIEANVIDALRTVYDPEIPVNIYELGLIYKVDVQPDGAVTVEMTLTSPACPVAGSLPGEVEMKVRNTPGVTSSKVVLVWEPAWTMAMMSDAAKLQLNLM